MVTKRTSNNNRGRRDFGDSMHSRPVNISARRHELVYGHLQRHDRGGIILWHDVLDILKTIASLADDAGVSDKMLSQMPGMDIGRADVSEAISHVDIRRGHMPQAKKRLDQARERGAEGQKTFVYPWGELGKGDSFIFPQGSAHSVILDVREREIGHSSEKYSFGVHDNNMLACTRLTRRAPGDRYKPSLVRSTFRVVRRSVTQVERPQLTPTPPPPDKRIPVETKWGWEKMKVGEFFECTSGERRKAMDSARFRMKRHKGELYAVVTAGDGLRCYRVE